MSESWVVTVPLLASLMNREGLAFVVNLRQTYFAKGEQTNAWSIRIRPQQTTAGRRRRRWLSRSSRRARRAGYGGADG